jgi:hypothetical protein
MRRGAFRRRRIREYRPAGRKGIRGRTSIGQCGGPEEEKEGVDGEVGCAEVVEGGAKGGGYDEELSVEEKREVECDGVTEPWGLTYFDKHKSMKYCLNAPVRG